MSATDTQFLNGMIANHQAGIVIAQKYLAAPPTDRNANITTMAKEVVTEHTADIAEMQKVKRGQM